MTTTRHAAQRDAGTPAEQGFQTWFTPASTGVAPMLDLCRQPLQASEQWINGLLDAQARIGHQYTACLRTDAHDGPLEPLSEHLDQLVDAWIDWRRLCWGYYFSGAEQLLGQQPAAERHRRSKNG